MLEMESTHSVRDTKHGGGLVVGSNDRVPRRFVSLSGFSGPMAFTRHLFRLRFTKSARFAHFLHGGVVHGLLGHALRDRQLPTGLIPTAPETGPVTYAAGDAYHVGITLVGVGEDLIVWPMMRR